MKMRPDPSPARAPQLSAPPDLPMVTGGGVGVLSERGVRKTSPCLRGPRALGALVAALMTALLLLGGGCTLESLGEELNRCGVAGADPELLGTACGECGVYACARPGTNELTCSAAVHPCGGVCPDPDQAPPEGAVPGQACGDAPGDTWRCTGAYGIQCVPANRNNCGGRSALPAVPATPCGETCWRDVWTCDPEDPERVFCEESRNPCGGCDMLVAPEGSECGECGGSWSCDPDAGQVTCDAPRNACGGCEDLEAEGEAVVPGDPCDAGRWVCAGEAGLRCADERTNLCGGESALDALPGSPGEGCSACTHVCAGPDATICVDAPPGPAAEENACGGCGLLPAAPGVGCGEERAWTCSDGGLRCLLDEEECTFPRIWYRDQDSDGLGDRRYPVWSCTRPPGYVDNPLDLCPDIPNDPRNDDFYRDSSGDGFGDACPGGVLREDLAGGSGAGPGSGATDGTPNGSTPSGSGTASGGEHGNGGETTDPNGGVATDPNGGEPTDPNGSEPTDPNGGETTDPNGGEPTDPNGGETTDPNGSDPGPTPVPIQDPCIERFWDGGDPALDSPDEEIFRTFDEEGRIRTERISSPLEVINTVWTWDSDGLLQSVNFSFTGDGEFQERRVLSWDEQGRLIEDRLDSIEPRFSISVTDFGYEGDSRQPSFRNESTGDLSIMWTITYDEEGRVSMEVGQDNFGSAPMIRAFSYDEEGIDQVMRFFMEDEADRIIERTDRWFDTFGNEVETREYSGDAAQLLALTLRDFDDEGRILLERVFNTLEDEEPATLRSYLWVCE